MVLLYESEDSAIIGVKLSRPLTTDEKELLNGLIPKIEEETHVKILATKTTPTKILLHCVSRGFFVITMSIAAAIATIAASIGLPITVWFLTHPEIPTGPLGLPVWFWVGVGIAMPLAGLGVIVMGLKR